jgi:hypothetical protein
MAPDSKRRRASPLSTSTDHVNNTSSLQAGKRKRAQVAQAPNKVPRTEPIAAATAAPPEPPTDAQPSLLTRRFHVTPLFVLSSTLPAPLNIKALVAGDYTSHPITKLPVQGWFQVCR